MFALTAFFFKKKIVTEDSISPILSSSKECAQEDVYAVKGTPAFALDFIFWALRRKVPNVFFHSFPVISAGFRVTVIK